MKIAYIIPSLVNKGPIVVVKNLVDNIINTEHQVDVYYFDELPAMKFQCTTKRISMSKPINFDDYDIIHSHCLRPDIYVAKWRHRIKRAKIVTTLHQDIYKDFCFQYNSILSYSLTLFWSHILSKFNHVVCISKLLENNYKNKIKAPLTTIYNGCAIQNYNTIAKDIHDNIIKLKSNYRILGTFAVVTKRKGLGQVIKALNTLKEYAFIIIGDGPDVENLKSLSKSLNLSNRVIFLPYQRDPFSFLPYFDIYIMASYSEGFGLAMVEAALAEKPIVCSNIPSFHEIFNDAEACFFELDNIESLSKAITKSYNNKEEYGKNAKRRAENTFTASKMTENYLEFYKNIIR